MNWKKRIPKKNIIFANQKKSAASSNAWIQCLHCKYILHRKELRENLEVCLKCDFHMQMTARNRILSFLDKDNIFEIGKNLEPKDILNFKDVKKYKDRLYLAQKETKEKDAIIVMQGKIYNIPIVVASFEFNFIGGSMSAMVGRRFILAIKRSLENICPLICFSSSGGARIQESLISLMQMAKISAALKKLKKKNIPYISILTNPTMGGVSASLAMLGDLNIAEPGALIGFAGPKIIEQTVRKKLPIEFQKSEFLLEKGMIDMIVRRTEMRLRIARLLAKLLHLPQPDV